MKHVLNRGDFGISLRFWVERFLHHKLVSLNNYKVDDRNGLSDVLGDILSGGRNSVARIGELCRVARRIGLIGINCYSTPVCKFCDHCTGLGLERMEDIDSDCVVHFMSVHTSGLKDATVRNYHFVISNFLDFVSSNNGQDGYGHVYDFSVPVFLKRARGDLPEYLTEDEMCSFLRSLRSYSIQGKSSKFIMVRNQLIVLMILYSGARVSEVLGVRSKDVVLDGNFYSMRIRGKGNKVRVVFVHADSVRPYFDEYQLMRASVTCDENLPLFVSSKLKPVSQPYIYSVIEGLLFSSGIRKSKNGAHLLRHSFATLLYRKSKDLVLVQESLGHSSIETSRIYTHFDNDGLKQAANIVSDALDG